MIAGAMMIISGSIHAVVNAILKGGRDRMASRAVIDGSSALLMLPVLGFVPVPDGAWGWLLASAAIHLVYLYALIRAFDAADLSSAYPILRGTAPLLTAIVTIGLLDEDARIGQVLGIAAIGCSVLAMVIGKHISRTGLGWALLTGATIAAYTIVDAAGVRAAPSPFSYIAWLFVMMGTAIVATFALMSRGRVFAAARAQWRPGVAAGALSIVTYGLALSAFALGPTAPLAALRETGMVTALIIATLFLGERVTVMRIVGVLGILAGAILILRA